jgi:predicted kinase
MVGLPGAGKTTRTKELAAEHGALRLSPDAWMIPLFGESDPGGKRDVLEDAHIAGPGSSETGHQRDPRLRVLGPR